MDITFSLLSLPHLLSLPFSFLLSSPSLLSPLLPVPLLPLQPIEILAAPELKFSFLDTERTLEGYMVHPGTPRRGSTFVFCWWYGLQLKYKVDSKAAGAVAAATTIEGLP